MKKDKWIATYQGKLFAFSSSFDFRKWAENKTGVAVLPLEDVLDYLARNGHWWLA